MGDTISAPEIFAEKATDAQRQSIFNFEQLASQTEPGIIEAALELQAQVPNLMPLVERVAREGLKRACTAWQLIHETGAFSEITRFDETTELLIDRDPEHTRLLLVRNAKVLQRNQGRTLRRPGTDSNYDSLLQQQEEALRDDLMRRKFIIFAGRLALQPSQRDEGQVMSLETELKEGA